MAVLGSTLTNPEPGWKRIDGSDGRFKLLGSGWTTLSDAALYNGAMHYTQYTSNAPQLEFTFVGSKFRYIGNTHTTHSTNIVITIDGITETFSQRGPSTVQCLEYEKLDLVYGPHTVQIHSTDSFGPRLDAIDIDDDGYLVASIGQSLTEPEPGWRRFDHLNPSIKLTGTWATAVAAGHYNGAMAYAQTLTTSKVSFSFVGTKLRYIGTADTSLSTSVTIIIDGVPAYFSQRGTLVYQAFQYEKLDLPYGLHTVEIYSTVTSGPRFDAIEIDEDGFLKTYKVNDALATVESGWKRYDDFHPAISYTNFHSELKPTTHYAGTQHYGDVVGAGEAKIKFKFKGTALRLGSYSINTYRLADVKIKIDDTIETFSARNGTGASILMYEKVGLEDTIHTVEIWNGVAITTHTYGLDFLDVNDKGRLLHIDEVLTLEELEVGKRIRCHYTVGMTQSTGAFSKLGEETYIDGTNDFISTTGIATPNGDFYFIMVEEENNEIKLIADRNVQYMISWNKLNEDGYLTNALSAESKFYSSPEVVATSGVAFWSAPRAERPFYVKFKAYIRGGGYLLSSGAQTSSQGFSINIGSKAAEIRADKLYYVLYNLPFLYNEWAEYMLVWTGYSIEWYVNDILKAIQSTASASTYANNNQSLTVLQPNNTTYYAGDAEITDIRFAEGFPGKEKASKEADEINSTLSVGYLSKEQAKSYNFKFGLLTGGTTQGDTDNDWDKHIINSNLDGKVTTTAEFWNTNIMLSHTRSTPLPGLVRVTDGVVSIESDRVTRSLGYIGTSREYWFLASTVAATYLGFRPCLKYERPKEVAAVTKKYLVEDEGVIKTIKGNREVQMTIDDETTGPYLWSAYFRKDILRLTEKEVK